jgi:DNA-binding transcriptional regulator LsrR (DeoR family)
MAVSQNTIKYMEQVLERAKAKGLALTVATVERQLANARAHGTVKP